MTENERYARERCAEALTRFERAQTVEEKDEARDALLRWHRIVVQEECKRQPPRPSCPAYSSEDEDRRYDGMKCEDHLP